VGEGRISAGDAHALEALRHQNFEIDRTAQMVTFEDLETLSKIDPGKFRSLTLTGWNCTDKTLAHFNGKDTPQMPIAVASRIAMSIPFFFKSPTYDAGQGEKSWAGCVAGSNMPAGAILDDLERALKRASADLEVQEMASKARESMDTRSRTLKSFDEQGKACEVQHGSSPELKADGWTSAIGAAILDDLERVLKRASADLDVPEMASKARESMDTRSRTRLKSFDEQGKAHEIQHGPLPEPEAGGRTSAIEGRLAGNPTHDAANGRDREKVYNAGPNRLVVYHGDMGTLSLSPSDEQKDAAVLGAQIRSVEAIAQRQNQATNEVFIDPASAARSLSPEQRAAFLRAGPPNPQAFANSEGVVDGRLHQAAVQFYREAARLDTSS
jgi:hypothetical protein